jgi:hypothetical protein
MDGFTAERWSKLTNAERIEHCQMAAREADTFAQSAGPGLRGMYEKLAAQWQALAAEIERTSMVTRT